MFGTAYGNSRLFFIFPIQWFFLVAFLKNVYGYWKISLTGFTGFLFGDLCDTQHGVFSSWPQFYDPSLLFFRIGPHISLSASVVLRHSRLSSRIGKSCCLWLHLLIRFLVFSRDVVRWVALSPVCIVKRIAFNARLILWVKPILSCRFEIFRFFTVCNACSTAPVPVWNLGGLYSFSMFPKHFVFFRYQRTSPIGLHFFRDNVKVIEVFQTFYDFFRFNSFAYPNYRPFAISINSNKNVWFAGYIFIL